MKDEANKMVLYLMIQFQEEKLAKLKQTMKQEKMERSIVRWDQKSEQEQEPQSEQPIEPFLKSIKMDSYLQKFKENGFEDLDILLDVQSEQLQQMEIPIGHQIRLMMKIKEFKKTSKYEALEDPQDDQSFSAIVKNTQINKKPRSSLKLQRDKSQKKVSFLMSSNQTSEASQDQSRQFSRSLLFSHLLEINEYLHKQDDIEKNNQSKISQNEESFEPQSRDQYTVISYDVAQVQEQLIEPPNNCILWIKKDACWQCYKLIENSIQSYGKKFCSTECINKYLDQNLTLCQDCKKEIFLEDVIIMNSYYFCSEQCSKKYDFEFVKDKDMTEQGLLGQY
ncbi:hypothetical protein pb186bvf_005824 [Paramecium bursaria]